MRTKFIPKERLVPAYPTFGELEVGQGFRCKGSPDEYVFVKVDGDNFHVGATGSSNEGIHPNCVASNNWRAYHMDPELTVIPVDLELREL
ncbi:MAG: hypothetical protein KGZ68_15135 [Dechloromonas sp.]|nr:hypothetical protein [Dechloromonas sp.]